VRERRTLSKLLRGGLVIFEEKRVCNVLFSYSERSNAFFLFFRVSELFLSATDKIRSFDRVADIESGLRSVFLSVGRTADTIKLPFGMLCGVNPINRVY